MLLKSLAFLAHALIDDGQFDAALSTSLEAASIGRPLVDCAKPNPRYLAYFAYALHATYRVEHARNHDEAALAALAECVEVLRRQISLPGKKSLALSLLAEWTESLADLQLHCGQREDSRSTLQQLVALRSRLAGGPNATVESLGELSSALSRLGDIEWDIGGPSSARPSLIEDIAIKRGLVERLGATWQRRCDLSAQLNNLGFSESKSGAVAAARDAYRECLTLTRALVAEYPDDRLSAHRFLEVLGRLGALEQEEGQLDVAWAAWSERADLLSGDVDDSIEHLLMRCQTFKSLGDVAEAREDWAGARSHYQERLAIQRQLQTADPRSAVMRDELLASLIALGIVEYELDDDDGARACFDEAVTVARQWIATHERNEDSIGSLRWVLRNLAWFCFQVDRFEDSRLVRQESIDLARQLIAEYGPSAFFHQELMETLSALSEELLACGDIEAARSGWREVVEIGASLAADQSLTNHCSRCWDMAKQKLDETGLVVQIPNRQRTALRIAADQSTL